MKIPTIVCILSILALGQTPNLGGPGGPGRGHQGLPVPTVMPSAQPAESTTIQIAPGISATLTYDSATATAIEATRINITGPATHDANTGRVTADPAYPTRQAFLQAFFARRIADGFQQLKDAADKAANAAKGPFGATGSSGK